MEKNNPVPVKSFDEGSFDWTEVAGPGLMGRVVTVHMVNQSCIDTTDFI